MFNIMKFSKCYDVGKLVSDAEYFYKKYRNNQINLKKYRTVGNDLQQQVTFGSGSLYDYVNKMWLLDPFSFNQYCDEVVGRYIQEVCNDVERVVREYYWLDVGRIRLLKMESKTCLSYHRDPQDVVRYHIPIITNEDVFFIIDDNVEKMPEEGRLYSIDPGYKHTVVNAGKVSRIHLVFDVPRKPNEMEQDVAK